MGTTAAESTARGMDVQVTALSPPDRLEAMRAYMLRWRLPMDLRPHRPMQVSAKSQNIDLGRSCLLSTTGSGATVVRGHKLSRDDTTPQLVLSVLGGGTSVVTQQQRTAHLRPGDLVVYTSTSPYQITFPNGTTRHSLMIRLDDLGLPSRLVTQLSARPFGPGDALTRLVSSYLLQLATVAPRLPGDARDAVEEPAISLTRALLTSVAGDDSAPDALGSSLETRLLEYLRQNFADREMSADKLAAVHGISERHLYTVLARAGITLRPWLRERRLNAAADTLSGPTHRRLTVAAVAHRWGFADQAHFTREFRKHFGMTPTQWRNHPGGS
ncbi:MAG: helix-turn-helix domain-containing protein [Mycobacterium sp.]